MSVSLVRAETYEERADQAEYQVERLEGMIHKFLRTVREDQEGSLEDLRAEWKRYREEFQ